MDRPLQFAPVEAAPGVLALRAFAPIPGAGVLAANSFVVLDDEPMVIDTGLPPLSEDFLASVSSIIDPARLRWIWLTHIDADHTGGLDALMEAAPEARIVTSMIGAAKLQLTGRRTDRVQLTSPGEVFGTGRRSFDVVRPPYFDAPETMGLIERGAGTMFAVDSFGALLDAPYGNFADIDPAVLADGLRAWAALDNPWLAQLDADRFEASLRRIVRSGVGTVLSSHLPVARGVTADLVELAISVQRDFAGASVAVAA